MRIWAQWLAGALGLALALWRSPAGAAEFNADAALDALVRAYPDELAGHDGSYLIWRDGTRMPVGGQAPRRFDEMLRSATILDQMRLAYPKGSTAPPSGEEDDPGRFRSQAFFDKMYGDCVKGEVAAHLRSIAWMPKSWGRTLRVTSVNGVARRLAAVSAEIEALPAAVRAYAVPSAGTYNCRTVADNGTRSMHAYGAAIDLNVKLSDYWLWAKERAGSFPYSNRMPFKIVDIFERHGFIWGGHWSHYDTMHFEYRPELLGLSGGAP